MSNARVELLRGQIKGSNEFFIGLLEGLTDEQIHWVPDGNANPISAVCAHIVMSQDAIVSGVLKQAAPLMASNWADKTGASELMPMPGPDTGGLPNWSEWAKSLRLDMAQFKDYASAVFEATDAYVAGLTDADLEKQSGFHDMVIGYLLSAVIISHTTMHAGEIACLKGLQGATGYPM